MIKTLVHAGFGALFAVCLFWASRQQVGEVYLKSGKALLTPENRAATSLLEKAAAFDNNNYLAHFFHAAALQMDAVAAASDKSRDEKAAAAIEALERVTAIRSDPLYPNLGAQIRLVPGDIGGALEDFNTSFFFGPRASGKDWSYLRGEQAKVAAVRFAEGGLGISLIMAYNHFSEYAPFAPLNEVTGFIGKFFLAVPPELWRLARVETEGPALRKQFAALPPDERARIAETMKNGGFGFLAEFLEAK